jgi:transcriptional regulator with XRE-family HTH domain
MLYRNCPLGWRVIKDRKEVARHMNGTLNGKRKDESRREQMARLRGEGLSLAEIGRRFGITRQGVRKALRPPQPQREPPTLSCIGCGAKIVSAGAIASDADAALCLPCLARRPEAPFAPRLKACRLAAGLTKKALADRAGVTRAAVQKYEDGLSEPRFAQLLRLVRVLGPKLALALLGSA